MMDPQAINDLTHNAAFWVILAWVGREILSHFKKKETDHSRAMEKNTQAISTLTIAITELKVRLTMIDDNIKMLPKMRDDINEAHSRIRTLNPEMFGRS